MIPKRPWSTRSRDATGTGRDGPGVDPRLAERKLEADALQSRRLRKRRIAIGAAALAFLVIVWVLLFSGLLAISQVDVHVSGTGVLEGEVQSAADAYLGTNYFRFDGASLVKELERDPGVGTVHLSRSFPHKLTVDVSPAKAELVLTPVARSGSGVGVNPRLQAMQGAVGKGALPTCLASVSFSGSPSDFACDHGATVSEILPRLRRVVAVVGAVKGAGLKPTSVVVFGAFGVGLSFGKNYDAYFADGAAIKGAVSSLMTIIHQGKVPTGAVVDLTTPGHPVVG